MARINAQIKIFSKKVAGCIQREMPVGMSAFHLVSYSYLIKVAFLTVCSVCV